MNENKILVIDDEPFMVSPILDRIEAIYGNNSFIYAQYINQGIDAINNQQLSCVCLDLIMPSDSSLKYKDSIINGLNLLKQIRDINPQIPIVCFTVVNDDEIIIKIESFNAVYINKTTKDAFYDLFDFFNTHYIDD